MNLCVLTLIEIGHPLYNEERVLLTATTIEELEPIKILATQPYIRHTELSMVGMIVDQWLAKYKVEVSDSMEMGSIDNLTSMVSHNLGVSIVPNICVPDPIFKELRKISLGPTAPTRTLGVLARTDCSKLRLVKRLLKQIKQVVSQNAASPCLKNISIRCYIILGVTHLSLLAGRKRPCWLEWSSTAKPSTVK